LRQQGIDTTTPGGKAMFQMLGVFAEFEHQIIQERMRACLRQAKAEGKQLGRPRIVPELEARILAALKAHRRAERVRKIAKRFSLDPGTVQRISCPFADASVAAWG
jgi:DNA invertase Pin-like site-specific DNA recombinase